MQSAMLLHEQSFCGTHDIRPRLDTSINVDLHLVKQFRAFLSNLVQHVDRSGGAAETDRMSLWPEG